VALPVPSEWVRVIAGYGYGYGQKYPGVTRADHYSYHYINHGTSDYLCYKWCNPAPLNGSAPNLVVVEYDININVFLTFRFDDLSLI